MRLIAPLLLLLLLVFAGTASADYSNVAPYDSAGSGAENWGATGITTREWLTYNHEYRIRQDGDITNVTLWVGLITDVVGFNVTIWRTNGSNFDRIAISEDISGSLVANTVNTITLSTPLTSIKEGDFYGYRMCFVAGSTPYHADNEGITSTYSVDSAVTTLLGYAWKSQTAHNYAMRIELSMEQPSNVLIGDSIIAGHSAHYSFIESTDTTVLGSAINAHLYNLTSEANQNMGIGSQTTTQISARFASDVVDLLPGMAIIEGGVNDIAGGSITQMTFLANYESMFQKCQAADIEPVVILIMPWSNGNNAQMTTRDQWNANLTTLAATYSATVVDTSSYVGIFRAGGTAGNLWDINASYNADGVHFNSAGHAQIAQAIYDNTSRLWHHHRSPTSGGAHASYVNDAATFTAIVNNVSNNTWYLDGAVVEYDNQTKYPSWTNSTLLAGSYNLTLSSSDEVNSAQTTWDWSLSITPTIIGQNQSDWGDYVSIYSDTAERGNHSITLDHNVSGYRNWWDHWTNTTTSTTLWDVAQDNEGSIGGAAWEGDYLHYDGTGHTTLTLIDYAGTDDWSIVFWAELDAGETLQSIIIGDTSDNNDFVWMYPGNYYRFRNSVAANADFTGLQAFTGMHHYIMVANGTHLVLYRNNTLINTITITTSFEMNAIGRGYSGTLQYNFDGLVGPFMMYNKAIVAHERNSIYNGHYKDTGNTTSKIIDSGDDNSVLNKIAVNGTFHDSTRCIDVYLNMSSDNSTWSGWSVMQANVTSGTEYTAGSSDQKRYWQFRLVLTSTQAAQTPIIETIEYKYSAAADTAESFVNPTFAAAGAAAIVFVAAAVRFAISSWRNRRRKRRN